MATATKPTFVMVCTRSPRGRFRRAGLDFTAEWRPLEVRATADVAKDVIDAKILKRLEAESMLAVKPASEAEIDAYQKDLADRAGKDPQAVIDAQQQKIADLEARLLRLELAKKGDGK